MPSSKPPTCATRSAASARWPTGRPSPRAGTTSRSTPTWPMAAATAAAASRVWAAGKQGPIARGAHQPHYQTLDYNTLNGGIERWFEPIDRRDRRRRHDAHHPRILPRAVRPARARDGALARRGPPVPHRGAARRARQADARGHASRRRRLRAGAAGRPPQHRQRHHDGPRPRQAHAGQLHPDRPARLRRWSTTRAAITASRRSSRRTRPSPPIATCWW